MKPLRIFFVFFIFLLPLNAEHLRTLYPPIEPYRTGFLEVEGGHTFYWEESGNPEGLPVLFLHGGPGLGTSPHNRSFFDPEYYRIILFDQRGCGKSFPFSSLENNTTWDLVKDIERLRVYLEINDWLLFGGSWGSTLGLTYAIKYPEKIKGLILRGIFLCRPKEISWFYQSGADRIFPDLWANYIAPIPADERENLVQAFYKRLTSSDATERAEAAKAWAIWELKTSKLKYDQTGSNRFTAKNAYSLARIESHYFVHNAFFDHDNWILENIHAIRHIPCMIIQGRYDIPCPMKSAWELHLAWPEAKFEIIPDAGHSSSEPSTQDALIRATEFFKTLGPFPVE
jgi:proline iminopeptidase